MRKHPVLQPNEKTPLTRVANLLGMAVLGYLALGGLLGWLQEAFAPPMGPVGETALSLVRYACALLLPFGLAGRSLRGVMPACPRQAQPLPFKLGALLAGMGAACLGNLLAWLMQRSAVGLGVELASSGNVLSGGLLQDLLTFVGYSLLAALVEEAVFRGTVLWSLRPWGDGWAVVCSAVLFALCHASPLQLAPALLTGLVLGTVAVSTGGIGLAVAVHTCYNAMAVLANRFAPADPMPVVGFWLGMTAMGLCALPLLVQGWKRRRPKHKPLTHNDFYTAPVLMFGAAVLALRLLAACLPG